MTRKDLTPELGELADAYLRAVRANPEYLTDDDWLLSVNRWRNQDHARVAAINHFVKSSKLRPRQIETDLDTDGPGKEDAEGGEPAVEESRDGRRFESSHIRGNRC